MTHVYIVIVDLILWDIPVVFYFLFLWILMLGSSLHYHFRKPGGVSEME